MKKGTKANAIDDLGKFDGSKITIKVNGKQIYPQKRYAIVRVDNSCPAMLDDFGCIVARNMLHCKCGEDTKNYGDTKEQLIRKVAQIRFKQEIKYGSKDMLKAFYNMCYRQAKEIVEFLGVEE